MTDSSQKSTLTSNERSANAALLESDKDGVPLAAAMSEEPHPSDFGGRLLEMQTGWRWVIEGSHNREQYWRQRYFWSQRNAHETPAPSSNERVNTARTVRAAATVPEICMHNVRLGQGCFCPHCPIASYANASKTSECPGHYKVAARDVCVMFPHCLCSPEARAAAKYDRDERARLAQKATAETNSCGVKCTHCNGIGHFESYYDEDSGWMEESPCTTCDGSGRIKTVEQYLKTLPANWHEDSSLQTWFPLTAEEHERYKRCLYRANWRLIQLGQEPEKLDYPEANTESLRTT